MTKLKIGGISVELGGKPEAAIQAVRHAGADAIVQSGKAWAALARHVLPQGHPIIAAMDAMVAEYEARHGARLQP